VIDEDYTKKFFQTAWGPDGYYENFSFGVGIDKVKEAMITPFIDPNTDALELGCGAGAFTEFMIGKFRSVTAIDVIKKPPSFFPEVNYIEAPDRDFTCYEIPNDSMDFVFSYGLFCHLSNEALRQYVESVYWVLRPNGNFTFMLSNYTNYKKYFPEDNTIYDRKKNLLLATGHFHQDEQTIYEIANLSEWTLVSANMIPEHRDICIHLKK